MMNQRGGHQGGGSSHQNSSTWQEKSQNEDNEYEKDDLVYPTESGTLSRPTPTCTLVVKGMKTITTEATLRAFLANYGRIEELRLLREKNGESKGIAFIDFMGVEDAENVMKNCQGKVTLDGQSVHVDYSRPNSMNTLEHPGDWYCSNCMKSNYARRKVCFSCQAPKPLNPTPEPDRSNSGIVVKGLDPSTTEDKIRQTFSKFAPIQEIRFIKDKTTHQGKGFCFIEFNNNEDAAKAIQASAGLKIDGKTVRVGYIQRGTMGLAPEQQQWLTQTQGYMESTYNWGTNNTDAKNTPQSSPAVSDALQLIDSQDLSQFVYDATTSYYYHANTGLYFHAEMKYYWDSFNRVYYHMDTQTGKYVEYVQPVAPPPQEAPKAKPAVKKEKTTLFAKKGAKEMERWNQQRLEEKAQQLKEQQEKEAADAIAEANPILNVCLLCKRQFTSSDALRKHEAISDLHKKNLEIERQAKGDNRPLTNQSNKQE
eukprot:TRINITY_DN4928_c0_g1_i1.p1 TRINITY_DN4928_c0_g1~~TRINITY_DN4928_c0_g1_i1.p1  ORF type:complete len:503 (+),score=140.08 TRINITY_DN4928_c0_g1_i1:67-1509(+)